MLAIIYRCVGSTEDLFSCFLISQGIFKAFNFNNAITYNATDVDKKVLKLQFKLSILVFTFDV